MKNYQILCYAAIIALSSCGMNSHNASTNKADSLTTEIKGETSTRLTAVMNMANTIKAGDSVLLNFTVKNNSDSTLRFCKWHTPFEPLMSKYLEVKNEKGEEMDYKGAMAKRMMPPPESSYISLKPQDSIAAHADLLKAYAITAPGKYTVTYVGENMSGLHVRDSVSFVYIK
jgi:hypothetical protein